MYKFEPRDPDYKAAVERFVAAQAYLTLLGVQLAHLVPGQVDYRIPYRADIGQQNGFFHGGVIGGVAEAVMGAAARTLVTADRNVVGAEYKINLLSPALGPAIIARGHVVKPGRTLIICRADVFVINDDGAEGLCAIAQGAMAVVAA